MAARANGGESRVGQEVPAFLDVSLYAADMAKAAGASQDALPYVPPGKIEQWHSELLKQRKVKTYDISCEVHVQVSKSYASGEGKAKGSLEAPGEIPARAWSIRMHEHPRFATLVPTALELIVPMGAKLPSVRRALEAVYEESAEKMNAWWNQKDTDHLRTRYVGSRFLYNKPRFKLHLASSSQAWTDDTKTIDTFLKESAGNTVKKHKDGMSVQMNLRVSMRMLRPASERRCSIM